MFTVILELPLEKAASLCDEQGLNWSLPVIQTEEAHQSLVRFMMEHNISSAWLGWKSEQLKNWTWGNSEICKYQCSSFKYSAHIVTTRLINSI